MWFIYKPEDGEPQEWWFDPQKVRAREAEAIEKRTGWDWGEFGQHLIQGSTLARRALLWTYQRRLHPTLRFEDVDFAMDEVELSPSVEEVAAIRAEMVKQDVPAETLAAFDRINAEARPGPGKAPASNGG